MTAFNARGRTGMRKLAVVGLAAAAAFGVYGCASIGRNAFAEPVVTLRDVKLQGIGLTGVHPPAIELEL